MDPATSCQSSSGVTPPSAGCLGRHPGDDIDVEVKGGKGPSLRPPSDDIYNPLLPLFLHVDLPVDVMR